MNTNDYDIYKMKLNERLEIGKYLSLQTRHHNLKYVESFYLEIKL